MDATVTVFGKNYSVRGAQLRLAELDAFNDALGKSDGRVTEANALLDALDKLNDQAEAARKARANNSRHEKEWVLNAPEFMDDDVELMEDDV